MTDYANKNIYEGSGQSRKLLVAKGAPIPSGVSVSGGDKTTDESEAIGLPITGYSTLEEADIVERMGALSTSNKELVRTYERGHEGRRAIVEYGLDDPDDVVQILSTTVPALAIAVDGDQTIGEVQKAGTVFEISYIPEADITGVNTNTRTLTVVNKGQDGNGTTVVGTLAFTTGVNATDFNESAFTLSAVAGAKDVAAGDVLAYVSTHGGTGVADPGGKVTVKVG